MSKAVETSIVIPARNEQFLNKTIEDLLAKARGEIEIIAVLDGYWPDPIVRDDRVHYIHFTEPRGMRPCLNAGVEIAQGKYVMKLDAHCMVAEGFDVILAGSCGVNWICVPTRHRLDAENWCVDNGGRPPINYLYLDPANDGMNFKEWRDKNRDRSLDALEVDDILSCQGSCYFLPRAYWHELELLDTEKYGTFRKDPQEVCFKAWLSGGRVVRIKQTWYAHLHKGKRYGRGYSTSRPDWAKGDEYVKRWYTDEAWDKTTKPWSWLMEKFSDMPGRAERCEIKEWNEGLALDDPARLPMPLAPPPAQEILDVKSLPNTYQYLEIDGRPFTRPRPDRAASRFWNEGKWANFIAPLLPEDGKGQTFVEMGCNAGLYLKMATDHGYSRVIGVEKNRTPVRVGLEYRDKVGGNWTILKRTLGGKFGEAGSFDLDEMPVADVTLMANWHYYVPISEWVKYADRLASKTRYVLVVSRLEMKDRHWMAQGGYAAICKYFDGWIELDFVMGVSKEDDPKPRDLYSILLSNPRLWRVPIADIQVPDDEMEQHKYYLAACLVHPSADFDLFETGYYDMWAKRKAGKWSERALRRFVLMKVDVMRSVMVDGLRDPLIIQRDGMKLSDGGHRLAMLKALGHTSVIVRSV